MIETITDASMKTIFNFKIIWFIFIIIIRIIILGNFGKYAISDYPFICLSACLWCDNSQTLQYIVTKLDPDMDLNSAQMPVVFLGEGLNS